LWIYQHAHRFSTTVTDAPTAHLGRYREIQSVGLETTVWVHMPVPWVGGNAKLVEHSLDSLRRNFSTAAISASSSCLSWISHRWSGPAQSRYPLLRAVHETGASDSGNRTGPPGWDTAPLHSFFSLGKVAILEVVHYVIDRVQIQPSRLALAAAISLLRSRNDRASHSLHVLP